MNTFRGVGWRWATFFWTLFFLAIVASANDEVSGRFAAAQENTGQDSASEEFDPPPPIAPPPLTLGDNGPAIAPGDPDPKGLRQFTRDEFPGDRIAWTILGAVAAVGLVAPGLLLFHAGWQGRASLATVGPQFLAATAILSLAWAMWIYSLAFARSGAWVDATPGEMTAGDENATDGNRFLGDVRHFFLQGMTSQLADDAPIYPLRKPADRVPHLLFLAYQMMFFVSTAAPLLAVLGQRLSTAALCFFLIAWGTVIYAPIAYWTWGAGWAFGALDSAGGLLAHVNIGFSAAAVALLWRKRARGPNEETPAAAPAAGVIVLGAVLFWAGSLLWSASRGMAADGVAASAFVVTHLAACAGLAAWAGLDWLQGERPGATALACGAVAGLAAIAPASGYVAAESSMVIGVCGAVVARFALRGSRRRMLRERAESVLFAQSSSPRRLFAIHGAAGALGLVLTGIFATASVAGVDREGIPINGAIGGNPRQLVEQLSALLASAALAFGGTFALLSIARAIHRSKPDEPAKAAHDREETAAVAAP